MKQYVLYGQVRQRLLEHVEKYGKPFSFYEAVRELWEENRFASAAELPVPPFNKWDTSRIDDFTKYMDLAPVDSEFFPVQEFGTQSARLASQRISILNGLPMMTAGNQKMGMHFHDAFELQYAIRGKARLYLNDGSRIFSEGELCIMAPHFQHDVVPDNDAIVVSITFWEHTIENTLFKLLKSENIIADFFREGLSRQQPGYMLFNLPPTEDTLRVIRSIFYEGYAWEEYSKEICVSYIEILFSYLLRHHTHQPQYNQHKETDASSLLSILKYIQTNYRDISLNQVAELFHYEPSYLGKKIRRETGKNFITIVSDLRLRDARNLLRNTNKTVEEIAGECGFKSMVHFSRSFKIGMGIPPSEYRKKNQAAELGK